MGSADIQAKVRKGLAKATAKTGSSSSDLVYVVKVVESGGDSPLNPPTQTPTDVLLVDAIFQSYEVDLIDGTIRAGDRRLVANGDVEILTDEVIKQGAVEYKVISVDIKAPTSDVLAYIAQVRAQ